MLNRAVPELKNWNVRLHTANQRQYRYQRCKRARFNTIELSQGLPDGMVEHLIEPDIENEGFLVRAQVSQNIYHHHTPVLEDPTDIPRCDIIVARSVFKYLGESQAETFLNTLHKKLHDGGFLLLSRNDRAITNDHFRPMNTVHGSALYTKNRGDARVEIEEGVLTKHERTVHDLSSAEYKQMVKHLGQLRLLDGISVGDHDKFMLQFGISEFRPDDKILHEGDPNTTLYGVISGHVSVWVGTGLLRRPEQLTSLGVGQLIGGSSALSRTICTATVVAESNVKVFKISSELLKRHYAQNPSFASKINSMVTRRAQERTLFQKSHKPIKAEKQGHSREGMGLVNEGRYILDEYSLPDGVSLTPVTRDLLRTFKEFSQDTQLLRGLPITAVETIANLLCAVQVKEDTLLIKEGTWPVGFYLICEGEADVYKGGNFFRIGSKVSRVAPGTFLGETSVIMRQKASASVISRTPMTLCALSRELFEYVYNSQQAFALEIDKICARRS